MRNHEGCRSMRHMHDRWPHVITQHARAERRITDIPQQGPLKSIFVFVIRWVTAKACRKCEGGHLRHVKRSGTMRRDVFADGGWETDGLQSRRFIMTHTHTDTEWPGAGGNEAGGEGMNDGWRTFGGLDGASDDPLIGSWVKKNGGCRCQWETLGGDVCWGVLPVCEGGGDPGSRGWWRGGPLSSSHPPAPGSAVQTAPPAPWPTPAEPLRSHTAPYTLHGPMGERGGVTHVHKAWYRLQHRERVAMETQTHLSKESIARFGSCWIVLGW